MNASSLDSTAHEQVHELKKYKAELTELYSEVRKKALTLKVTKSALKEQLEFSNTYRNIVIAALVALYTPLSFTSVSQRKSLQGFDFTNRAVVVWNEYYCSIT